MVAWFICPRPGVWKAFVTTEGTTRGKQARSFTSSSFLLPSRPAMIMIPTNSAYTRSSPQPSVRTAVNASTLPGPASIVGCSVKLGESNKHY